MKLNELLNDTTYKVLQGQDKINVTDIVQDSRKAKPGVVFVCIKGSNFDGHDMINDVLSAGVTAIVVEKEVKVQAGITVIQVENSRKALAYMSCAYFDYPARKLKTIGITGTKGKTTTTYMVKHILEQSGIKTGLIGTIEVLIGEEKIDARNTTPEAYTLQSYLKQMADAGCDVVVMEVSSQGLMLDRVTGIEYDYGVFTNISPDHIGPNDVHLKNTCIARVCCFASVRRASLILMTVIMKILLKIIHVR